jgi:hypothetical protein
MSYDFHGAWDTVTSPQAPLYNKERKTTGAPLTDKMVQQVPFGPFGIDNFTIIRGNEVWNDPFDKKAGQPYPHRNVGVPHQKIYTGFSTYGRGWSLKHPITAQNDPAFKYGTPSLCHDPTLASLAPGEKSTFPLPACCPGCNGNGARDVTKERGISTLYDLEESQAGLWNADTAFRKFDEGTVTAYAASGDQFISYDTWETLAMKAVWMRDDWLKGTSRMPGNGRYGGGIIWSIDTDDFNNAMPHHWVIACYLESNYYLSKTPMCQCRFWKTWAKNNLPGAPANIDDQFKICNRTACNADDPLGLLDDGVRRRRTSDAAGAPHSGSSTYIHHDSHSRIEHNRAASEEIQKRRIQKHEREVHHHRQHHLRRRMDYHQKHGTHTTRQHGRRLVPDRRHLTADSVTAPVHECTTQLDDVTVFKPPPFTDNCASDVTLPDTCPAKNGNTMLRPAKKIYNKTTGELIGELRKLRIKLTNRFKNGFC